MLFNSWTFIAFILLVLPIYYSLKFKAQNPFLLIASYTFYGFWDWRFLILLWLSTIIDFSVARKIQNTSVEATRKRLLIISLCANLGILGFFKYFNFFIDSATQLLQAAGMNPSFTTLHIILPVGISFYTFQTMAYTIDVYRKKQTAIDNIIDYAVYVSYFPQLVAGPIERAQRLLPQIQKPRSVSKDAFYSGIQLILWGYLKKVAIADSMAPIVSNIFDNPQAYGSATLVLGVYCFALQIYGDFSGYSDIARGISRLFGIELMVNFKQPYLSRNITEFWRRWHISLSTWLRDYLYIPLGGNRKGTLAQYRNLMITMLLGGLWHGAGWNFILWGGLHGLYLSLHKLWTRDAKISAVKPPRKILPLTAHLFWAFITFNLVCLTWIPFRSADFSVTMLYIERIITLTPSSFTTMLELGMIDALIFYSAIILLIDLKCWWKDSELPFSQKSPIWARTLAYSTALLILALIREGSNESFIYFQF